MGAHALGAAAYAAKAASLAADDQETARHGEVHWQLEHMTPDTRAALACLPLLGKDTSGPLGAGLLSSGVLALTIREIQSDLTAAR